MIARFRRLFKVATPGFLNNPNFDGEKVLYTLGLLCDAFAEKALRGLEARFPGRASPSAQALIAGDRGLIKGKSEPDADLPGKPPGFITRLRAWRNPRSHRVRGNAVEAVRQVWNYWWHWFPGYADVFDSHFVITAKEANGNESRFDAGIWDWDGADPDVHWARFWVTLDNDGFLPQPDFGDPDLWGGALDTPGFTLGQTGEDPGVLPTDVTAMRSLFQELGWGPGNAQPEWLLLTSEEIGGGSFPSPDGTWKYWSKDQVGTRVSARASEYRYWSLDPLYNNTYAGDRTRAWPAASDNVDLSGTYVGDRTNGAAFGAIELPDGSTYAGTRRWPARVLLLDDGSVPK